MNRLRAWWARIRKPKTMVSDRWRVREMIRQEALAAAEMADFLSNSFNNGHAAKIMVEVDGVMCPVGVLCGAGEPLMEYLANWACAKSLKKRERLEEFDRASVLGAVDNGNKANSDDAPDREGLEPEI